MKYTKRTPCDNCPFRTDRPAYLNPERAEEIVAALDRGTFPCHKTIIYTEDDEGESVTRETKRTQHCAGALILCEKEERPGQMMRIAERLRLYDHTKLDMNAPVHDSFQDFIDAQPVR